MGNPLTLEQFDTSFVQPKPREEVLEERIAALEQNVDLFSTRKFDGHGCRAIATGDRKKPILLQTRTGNDVTGKFPSVVDELRALSLPKLTLVPGELFWRDPVTGLDDLTTFGRFAGSSTANAVALEKEIGSARCMLFTPLVLEGADMSAVAYRRRADIVAEWLDKRTSPLISHMKHLDGSFADLKVRVVKEKWEGLVLYDANATTEFAFHGKHDRPPRPDGCWKWKPIFEGDFVVTKFEPGKGKNLGLAGKIYIAQVDPRTEKLVPCGEVPLHTKEHKMFFAQKAVYPLVVQVEYEIRTPKGALRISNVMRVRDDKGVDGCILPEKYWK